MSAMFPASPRSVRPRRSLRRGIGRSASRGLRPPARRRPRGPRHRLRTTHCTSAALAPMSRWIEGTAIDTIPESRTLTKPAASGTTKPADAADRGSRPLWSGSLRSSCACRHRRVMTRGARRQRTGRARGSTSSTATLFGVDGQLIPPARVGRRCRPAHALPGGIYRRRTAGPADRGDWRAGRPRYLGWAPLVSHVTAGRVEAPHPAPSL